MVTLDASPFLDHAKALLAEGLIDLLVLGTDEYWLEGRITDQGDNRKILSLDAAIEVLPLRQPMPMVEPNDLALIQYTGGTTGLPKGAMISHTNLTSAVAMFDRWMHGQPFSRPGTERHIGVLPLFHIYALAGVLVRSVHNGETLLLRSRFDPEQTLRDIAESRATWFFAVPTMLIALADAPTLEDHDLSSLTYCVAGGAPLPNEVAERIKRAIGQAPAIGWGMTETSGAGTLTVAGDPAPAGVIGYPLPNVTIEIVSLDDPHLVVPPGEIGEIRIKGPNVVEGYWNRPEENAAAFADGFLLTGDVGFLDATGQVHIVDRKKDLIISSGFNVYPRAVEEAIYEHPAIEEVLVYGAPDRYRGEVAVAAIKLRNGAGPLTLEALRAFLSDKLGRHEIPARIEIHDALPRTAVGKLSKKELRETSAEKRGLSHD